MIAQQGEILEHLLQKKKKKQTPGCSLHHISQINNSFACLTSLTYGFPILSSDSNQENNGSIVDNILSERR